MSEYVRNYYDATPEREWERLDTGLSRVEFAATQRLIEKYFPEAGDVCDGRWGITNDDFGGTATFCYDPDGMKVEFHLAGLNRTTSLTSDLSSPRECVILKTDT